MDPQPREPARAVCAGRDPRGEILGERFVVEQLRATGGMGAVYRGTDRESGGPVAIKLLSTESKHAQRLVREAAILAEFSHPAIVRHLAHGLTSRGEPFLVMEWLDGEDLAARLARAPLSLEQSLRVLRRTCEGLSEVHARGVVHRDLKPSNLFLVGGDPSSLKLLDFGIARLSDETRTLTHSGALLGSVGYMSPEQAMGLRGLDARADVFALGCVLFECITGRVAFSGPNKVAVLAKILREEPFRASELRPGLAPALDALVARMLSKHSELRPRDATAVLHALERLDAAVGRGHGPVGRTRGLTTTEQKIVSVILGTPLPSDVSAGCETREEGDAELCDIRAATERIGAEPIALSGGGLLVMVSGRGAAHDQAAQAASCALALARARPHAHFSVATGRAETEGRLPVGAAIDRAARLLESAESAAQAVAVDELTADLVPPHFRLAREGGKCWLIDQRDDFEAQRRLLGKPAPFIGRERELALLALTMRECSAESVVRAVTVIAPPGQGKSRLRQEFTGRLPEQVRVWIARGDPLGAGSAFGALRQIVRQAIGLRDGTPSEQRAALQRHVAGRAPESPARVADFLGELLGVSANEPASPELRAARNDPCLMRTWLSRSFCEWLEVECAGRATLIVLEDLHWGDAASLSSLGEAMRKSRSRALMVLALARPELRTTFPNLWPGLGKVEIELGTLGNGAAEQMVREVLGDTLARGVTQRIVERAAGNPLYLEELIRHAALGAGDKLPDTVLALAQSRLEQLPGEERWVARAASIFGEVFWRGGLATLLGPSASSQELDGWLGSLSEREVIAVVPDARFAGEREYTFRHGLLRDAAYNMLTDEDRVRGHELAGEWLVQAGEKDALVLADHFELGREPKQAVPWIVQAALLTLDAGNLDATLQLGERAARCGADAQQLGHFAWMRAAVLTQVGDLRGAASAAQEALRVLKPGGTEWFQSAGNLLLVAAFLGEPSLVPNTLQAVSTTPPEEPSCGGYSWAMCTVCSALVSSGQLKLARSFLARMECLLEPGEAHVDPACAVNVHLARGGIHLFTGELGLSLTSMTRGRELADRLELFTQRALARCLLACGLAQAGSIEDAEAVGRELDALCDPRRVRFYADRVAAVRGAALAAAGRVDEATALLEPLLDSADKQLVVGVRSSLALILCMRGEMDAASSHAHDVLREGAQFLTGKTSAAVVLARIALARGRPAEALAAAEAGLSGVDRGIWLSNRLALRLARACALRDLGEQHEACAEIRAARDQVRAVQASLPDRPLRESFVTNVATNARILALADAWLAES